LVSTYELGHQPLDVASPAAELRARGHDVRAVDVAVDAWDPSFVDEVDAVGVSVPMHTALRLGQEVVASVRARRPTVPIAAYGLYAGMATDVDARIAGEYEAPLADWVDGIRPSQVVHLGRHPVRRPDRDLLPGLDRYARLLTGCGDGVLAGAVQTARGCASRCRHCPVPVVYGGRVRPVDIEVVLADVDQLVAAGGGHVTFADPDFLSAPAHALRVVRAMGERHPQLTFDLTTKVELVLRHRSIWPALAEAGCLFVVSALECVDDAVLALLDKGHTAADASEAVGVLRVAGLDLRPSLLPFTPWTTVDGLVALVDFVVAHDLAANVEPAHWSIRLLLPQGSLLLGRPELAPHLRGYDALALSYRWNAADPEVDALQALVAKLVEAAVAEGVGPADVTRRVAALIRTTAGLDPDVGPLEPGDDRPRLSEAWFCCAEPTSAQHLLIAGHPG
jgi:hypothetical protein